MHRQRNPSKNTVKMHLRASGNVVIATIPEGGATSAAAGISIAGTVAGAVIRAVAAAAVAAMVRAAVAVATSGNTAEVTVVTGVAAVAVTSAARVSCRSQRKAFA